MFKDEEIRPILEEVFGVCKHLKISSGNVLFRFQFGPHLVPGSGFSAFSSRLRLLNLQRALCFCVARHLKFQLENFNSFHLVLRLGSNELEKFQIVVKHSEILNLNECNFICDSQLNTFWAIQIGPNRRISSVVCKLGENVFQNVFRTSESLEKLCTRRMHIVDH